MMADVISWRSSRLVVAFVVAIVPGMGPLAVSTAEAALKHQYLFNEGPTSDATGRTIIDNISGANGTVAIPGAGPVATAGVHALVLPGGGQATAPYVDLPNGMISVLTDATFESWYRMTTSTAWTRIFDFGARINIGEVLPDTGNPDGQGVDYIFWGPTRGGGAGDPNQQRAGIRDDTVMPAVETLIDTNIPYTLGNMRHVAVVYDSDGGATAGMGRISVYLDGQPVGAADTPVQLNELNDVNNWLGRSNWAGDQNLAGELEEFRIYDQAMTATDVLNSFNTGFVGPKFEVEVSRDSGAITLRNEQPSIQIVGYSITSPAGGLNSARWLSVADNYDANSGGSFDNDNVWTELSTAGSKTEFAEFDFSTGGTAGGAIGAGAPVTTLQLGGGGTTDAQRAWVKSTYEDVAVELRLADGSTSVPSVRYTGNGGVPFRRSDLNFDNQLTIADWNIFVANSGTDLNSLTPAESYRLGDLNGDLTNDYLDFRLFKADYNAANGAGAFALLLGVPEPSTLAMLALGGVALVGARARRRIRPWFALAGAMLVLATFQNEASADLKHRYSFNEGAAGDATGRTITDSVSGAHGTVLGAGSSATATELVLPGGASATQAYVDLPNGIISSLTNATFEAWYTMAAPTAWTRIFDFGSTVGPGGPGTPGSEVTGPGGGGEGQDYIFFAPTRGAPGNENQQRVAIRNFDPLFGGSDAGTVSATEMPTADPNVAYTLGTQRHVAVVFDSAGGTAPGLASVSVYIDGVLAPGVAAGNPANTPLQLRNLNDVNNWLGRSNWTGDENFNGSFNEFRIYDLSLTAEEVQRSFDFGPDDVAGPDVISLEVDAASGQVRLVNDLARPITIDFYEITSDAGSLNPAWAGVDGATTPGEGWDRAGGASENLLRELYLPEAGFTVPAGGQVSIGTAFDPGAAQDLQFRFGLAAGIIREGDVSYAVTVLPGDFSGNGSVENADLTLLLDNWGAPVPPVPTGWVGAQPTSPAVDNDELTALLDNWGATQAAGGVAPGASGVPEPTTFVAIGSLMLGIAAWLGLSRPKRLAVFFSGSGNLVCGRALNEERRRPSMATQLGSKGWSIVAIVVGLTLATAAQAGTPDRVYRFGDDSQELPAIGGTPNASFGLFTVDSQVLDTAAFSDAADLSHNSGPTYFDAGSGPLARPGAAVGSFGLQFGGDDLLFDIGGSLGAPEQGDDLYVVANGAPGYTGITTRYIDAWVRPTGGAGTRRDVVNDSARFGIFIGADNNWGFVNGTTTVNSSTPAMLNQWTHVMHRTFGSTGGAVLLVNGIAVAATPNGYTNNPTGQALDIVVGAGLNQSSNFFQGQLDDMVIGVAGNNTGQPGGRDYEPVNLAQDNDFIRQDLVGVNAGDINRDGLVNSTDVNTFVTNWRRAQQLNGVTVGDLNSRAFGDLNMNGAVDLDDAYTLHAALRAAGGAGLDFSLLGAGVPEPGSLVLLASGLSAVALGRRRDRRQRPHTFQCTT